MSLPTPSLPGPSGRPTGLPSSGPPGGTSGPGPGPGPGPGQSQTPSTNPGSSTDGSTSGGPSSSSDSSSQSSSSSVPSSLSSTPVLTSSTPSSTTQDTVTSTQFTAVLPPPGPVTQTQTSFVNASPTGSVTSSSSQNDIAKHSGFFSNKGAVAGVFTVVGLIALALLIAIATNIIRRRRAKKFDDEVANAAAAAYADADRGPGWADEDEQWQDGPSNSSRAYTGSSGGHTAGTLGAYGGAPMPVPVPGQQYHDDPRGNAYNMEEFPQRNQPNPFSDQVGQYTSTGVAAGGIAGVGAAAGQEMRHRAGAPSPFAATRDDDYADVGINDAMVYDSGRYPVPNRTSWSQGHAGPDGNNLGRSPSLSSNGHSYPMVTQPGRFNSPPPMPNMPVPLQQQQRLPQTQEVEDEDPYDGFTPESERSEPHMSEEPEVPRVLRVANA